VLLLWLCLRGAIIVVAACILVSDEVLPPSYFLQVWDIGHGMHIVFKPLAFDHVWKINVFF
jgi:hypothetical protein